MGDFQLACVLFDLDGTLVDTAPDLVASLNRALEAHGLSPVSPAEVGPMISHGAAAMIGRATDAADPALRAQLLDAMLDSYQANIAEHSRCFAGIEEVLAAIEALGLKWGVVTNKRQRFTQPLLQALGLDERAACIVSGDSTAHPKPHPAPMLAACRQAGVAPENCVYVGDAVHDIAAGKSANMKTLAAAYGYLQAADRPQDWGADGLIEHPRQLLDWIRSAL